MSLLYGVVRYPFQLQKISAKKKIAVFVFSLSPLLVPCAQGPWMRPGATSYELAADQNFCNYQAAIAVHGGSYYKENLLGAILIGATVAGERQLISDNCMAARGWMHPAMQPQQFQSPPPEASTDIAAAVPRTTTITTSHVVAQIPQKRELTEDEQRWARGYEYGLKYRECKQFTASDKYSEGCQEALNRVGRGY